MILNDHYEVPATRPCAFENTLTYDISNRNASSVISSTSPFSRYDQSTYSVKIQTDREDMVGIQKTIIRDCDVVGRLLELNLYIDVLSNTHPFFCRRTGDLIHDGCR